MAAKPLIASYTAYNHWANVNLTLWLQSFPRDLVYREMASSYPSIDLTLQHLTRAQNFWLAIITGQDVTKLDESVRHDAFDSTVQNLLAGSLRMIDVFGSVSEDELMREISSPAMRLPQYAVIVHAINHNTHHRGQIFTMSRALGVMDNIPSMDYEVFLWERQNQEE